MVKVVVIDRAAVRREFDVAPGLSLLDVARAHDLDIEGRCEGSLACSTCHVIVEPSWFEKLNEAGDDEQDMLDTVAIGLTSTSRLGCQIRLSPALDGLVVRLPVVPAR